MVVENSLDDVLAIDAGGLTSSLSFTAQLRVKAVLLTHHHYDHLRDIPALAMNAYLRHATIDIYSTPSVRDMLSNHLLNDDVYPNFFSKPPEKPTLTFTVMEPGQSRKVLGYQVLAERLGHSVPAVGFQVTSPDGKAMFYTGDTGPGLDGCWQGVSPQLLIIEVTAPNSYEEFARQSGHLAPRLLHHELTAFQRLKGYLPRVVVVHMNPAEQKRIAAELAEVSSSLSTSITLAAEGMVLTL